jgi:hypothetical protein
MLDELQLTYTSYNGQNLNSPAVSVIRGSTVVMHLFHYFSRNPLQMICGTLRFRAALLEEHAIEQADSVGNVSDFSSTYVGLRITVGTPTALTEHFQKLPPVPSGKFPDSIYC